MSIFILLTLSKRFCILAVTPYATPTIEEGMTILNLWTKYGKSVILPAIIIGGLTLYFLLSKEAQSPEPILLSTAAEQSIPQQTDTQDQQEEQTVQIVVDVKGAVEHPGVYPFTTEDRIIDAISAAGGYTSEADTRFINHAQKLTDELVIYVPKKGEEIEQTPTITATTPSTTQSSQSESDIININTATEAELTTLPGIGPSKAAAILAYREENGQFKTIEDLKNVSGIGDKTFERLQPLISVK